MAIELYPLKMLQLESDESKINLQSEAANIMENTNRLNISRMGGQLLLTGAINELSDFLPILQETKSLIALNLANVQRINSAGVRNWMLLLDKLSDKQVEYHACSIAFVNTINMINDFLNHATIISLMAPFFCSQCEKESEILLHIQDIKKANFLNNLQAGKPCITCKGFTEFNDDPG